MQESNTTNKIDTPIIIIGNYKRAQLVRGPPPVCIYIYIYTHMCMHTYMYVYMYI